MNKRRSASVTQRQDWQAVQVRAALEQVVDQRVVQCVQRQCEYQSSYRLDELDVVLEDGTELALMVKIIGPDGLTAVARAAKPEFLINYEREVAVYRAIRRAGGDRGEGSASRSGSDFGLAYFFGAKPVGARPVNGNPVNPTHNPQFVNHLLFIERVSGSPLYEHGDFSVWESMMQSLAELHQQLSVLPTHNCHLVNYDFAYFMLWPRRALAFATTQDQRQFLRHINSKYESVAQRLAMMKKSFIHGELYPSNVLVRDQRDSRFCPVDWELAGYGPAVIDVAALTTGSWSEGQRESLIRTYYQTALASPNDDRPAASHGGLHLIEPSFSDFMLDVAHARLHLAMQWLGWSQDWTPIPEHAFDWLGEVRFVTEEHGIL